MGAPLQCAGFGGYTSLLVFWMLGAVLVLLAIPPIFALASLGEDGSGDGQPQSRGAKEYAKKVLFRALPSCLQLLFFAYPIVSTVAFKAFDCEDFGDAGRWLRADYATSCDDAAYDGIKALASLAIVVSLACAHES